MPTVRPYRPQDRAAILDICLKTGDDGRDATGLYSDDRLLPMIYAEPYLQYQPELAFVVDSGDQTVGYILGTSNTVAFAQWYRQVWIPRNAEMSLDLTTEPAQKLWHIHSNPQHLRRPELLDYPAQLHIDLLPEIQGSGMGRALMNTFLRTLAAATVPAVHLAMSATNEGAGHFYRHLGFTELAIEEPATTYFGRKTS